ncbi:MAG: rhomboid family intramembrane serine protease [Methanosarcinales archaeon]|nr:rhomboid family intramembrane serine protease [Methanosarcinales archaeon]
MKLTYFLILLCSSMSLYAWTNPDITLAFSLVNLVNGNYYTLLTAIFVHGDYLHLAGNMVFLFLFGTFLEDEVGAFRTGVAFITGGTITFLLSIPFYPNSDMVGASAAIFTLMAVVLLVREPCLSGRFLSPIGPLAILFFIFNLVDIQSGTLGNVAYISHAIGFVLGLFMGAGWNKEWKESLVFTLLLLTVYMMVYNFLIMAYG